MLHVAELKRIKDQEGEAAVLVARWKQQMAARQTGKPVPALEESPLRPAPRSALQSPTAVEETKKQKGKEKKRKKPESPATGEKDSKRTSKKDKKEKKKEKRKKNQGKTKSVDSPLLEKKKKVKKDEKKKKKKRQKVDE